MQLCTRVVKLRKEKLTVSIFENESIIIRETAENENQALLENPQAAALLGKNSRVYAVAGKDGGLYGALAQCRYAQWGMEGLVFVTLPEHRRRGYAAAAVRAFTRWFYDNTDENMLVAVVDLENVAAVRTLERAGYEYIRTTTLEGDDGSDKGVYHLFVCSRAVADAGAPPRGCCCGCGGHAE